MDTKTVVRKKSHFSGEKEVVTIIDWDLSYTQAIKELPWLNSIDEAEYDKARAGKKGKQKITGKLIPPPHTSIKKCLDIIKEKGYEPFGLIETVSLGMKMMVRVNGFPIASLGFKYKVGSKSTSDNQCIPVRKGKNKIKGYLASYVLDIRNLHLAIK